ncbi:MAG: condensation domain-containing protein, partial [Bacteroidota bacterium]
VGSVKPDLIIINEVVQYMPSVEYLVRVVTEASRVLAPGGHIFIGGVRSYPLLDLFHFSVQLHRSDEADTLLDVKGRADEARRKEKELAVDPAFFQRIAAELPELASAEVRLRGGEAVNELTKYRYDVVLGTEPSPELPRDAVLLDWEQDDLSIAALEGYLESAPTCLVLKHVPNVRIRTEGQARKRFEDLSLSTDASVLVDDAEPHGVNPGALEAVAHEAGYELIAVWEEDPIDGYFSAYLYPIVEGQRRPLVTTTQPAMSGQEAWATLGNLSVVKRNQDDLLSRIRLHLKSRLPSYMVPSSITVLDALPLTSNGKVDRRALRALLTGGPVNAEGPAQVYEPPRTPLEHSLADTLAGLLERPRVGRTDDFFALGGHSLMAMQLVARLRRRLGVELSVRAVFDAPTVEALAAHIETLQASGPSRPPLEPQARPSEVPVSFAQQRLWFLHQIEPESPAYNIPVAVRLTGPLSVDALRGALRHVVGRHEALRTRFVAPEGVPQQVITAAAEAQAALVVPVVDVSGAAEARQLAEAEASRPFSLEDEALVRATLIRIGAEEHVLLLTVHHIVADGWSMDLLVEELTTLYGAALESAEESPEQALEGVLPALPVQYADYALWQRGWLQGAALEEELTYWRERLTGAPTVELAPDFTRPAMPRYRGARARFDLSDLVSSWVRSFGQRYQATPYMVFLAAFKVLVGRYTGREDVVVGTDVAGRTEEALSGLVGFFVNTLVLRTSVEMDASFEEVVSRVRETVLGAQQYGTVPFERVVEEVKPERDTSRHPLFQILFSWQDTAAQRGDGALKSIADDLTVSTFGTSHQVAQFDLSLEISEDDGRFTAVLEYDTDLYT